MKTILGSSNFKKDFSASIVVFLVALPLAMGVSIASGYPPVAGLITGIVGGIVVGLLSGSPLQVSGAAAGLAVVLFESVQKFGLATMGLIVLLAGFMQVAAAAARLGRWFQAVSPTVLHGMLAGIGILIFASQMHVMVGQTPPGSGLSNLSTLPELIQKALTAGDSPLLFAFVVGLFSIAVMLVWPKFKKLSSVPAPLAAVLLASVLAYIFSLNIAYVEIPKDLFSNWEPQIPSLSIIVENPAIAVAAFQLALIASAESLLCAGAVDQMHDGARTQYDRELAAQGVGNALCGALGVLPMTGVIVRSSANVSAGARTRLSTILHGFWILLFVALLPMLLNYIPIAALAGLLVYTGLKLVNVKLILKHAHTSKGELVIFAVTLGVVVSVDLLLGVLTGLALAGIRLLKSLSHLSVSTESQKESEEFVIHLRGAATFLRLPKLSTALEKVPPKSKVKLESHNLYLMDEACSKHLEAWRRRHLNQGGQVEVDGKTLFSESIPA